MLASTQFWLRVFLLEWFREQFFSWLLFRQEWNQILWFRFKCGFQCDVWCLGLRCWCTVGHICSICIAGGRLKDFVPLLLVHCIACNNVDVVVCSYVAFIEYNIALNSDRSFLWPVYLIAFGLQIIAYESSNLGMCI